MKNYPIFRRLSAALVLGCVLVTIAVSMTSAAASPTLVWGAFVVTLLSCLAVLFTPGRFKRDGVLFLLCAIGGGVVVGAAGPFPANAAIWLWIIVSITLATVGIVFDADRSRSSPGDRS